MPSLSRIVSNSAGFQLLYAAHSSLPCFCHCLSAGPAAALFCFVSTGISKSPECLRLRSCIQLSMHDIWQLQCTFKTTELIRAKLYSDTTAHLKSELHNSSQLCGGCEKESDALNNRSHLCRQLSNDDMGWFENIAAEVSIEFNSAACRMCEHPAIFRAVSSSGLNVQG